MSIKNIIVYGFGFTPGSVKYIPTHGFTPPAPAGADVTRIIRVQTGLSADTFAPQQKMIIAGGRRRMGGR